MKILFQILFLLSLSGYAVAQESISYFVGIYKSSDIEDARSISARTYEKSKLIKWYDESLWVVAIGPTTLEHAKEIEADIAAKTRTQGQTQIIKFPNSYLKWDSEILNAYVQILENQNPTNFVSNEKEPIQEVSKNLFEEKPDSSWIEYGDGTVEGDSGTRFKSYLREDARYANLRKVFWLTNWSHNFEDKAKSRLIKILVDCQGGKFSQKERILYSDLSAKGTIMKSEIIKKVFSINDDSDRKLIKMACGSSKNKDSIEVKNEWDQLLNDIKNEEKIAEQAMENMRKRNEQQKKLYAMADASCKPALSNRFNTIGKNRYGVISGRKLINASHAVTYDAKTTSMMGKGNNFLSIYTVVTDNYQDGHQSGRSILTVNCIISGTGQVLGLEVDYR